MFIIQERINMSDRKWKELEDMIKVEDSVFNFLGKLIKKSSIPKKELKRIRKKDCKMHFRYMVFFNGIILSRPRSGNVQISNRRRATTLYTLEKSRKYKETQTKAQTPTVNEVTVRDTNGDVKVICGSDDGSIENNEGFWSKLIKYVYKYFKKQS